MSTATKTILFGTHNFIVHPIFVFIAWLIRYRKLPSMGQLLAIFVHDLGLFGKDDIDGESGESHPEAVYRWLLRQSDKSGLAWLKKVYFEAAEEVVGHSRFYAMKYNHKLSKLFQADKLGVGLYPSWLYIMLGTLSGEINEYMTRAENGKYKATGQFGKMDKLTWFLDVKSRLTIMGLDRDVEKYMQNKNHWN